MSVVEEEERVWSGRGRARGKTREPKEVNLPGSRERMDQCVTVSALNASYAFIGWSIDHWS